MDTSLNGVSSDKSIDAEMETDLLPCGAADGKSPRKQGSLARTAATNIVSAIIGGLIVLAAQGTLLNVTPKATPVVDQNHNTVAKQAASSNKKSDGSLTAQQVYRQFGPAIVHVHSTITRTGLDFFGMPFQSRSTSDGSGFVVDSSGYIVTNAHVVEGADNVTVILTDKQELSATIVGMDMSNDLALLRVDPAAEHLTVIQLGDSSKVQVGDVVYAIGNPFSLDGSMSSGIVSAVGRQIQAPNGFAISNVIQTDAAVNPGNSGGPLIDAYGQVVGVNAQIESQANQFAGIAFAIPSNTVKTVIEKLKSNQGL